MTINIPLYPFVFKPILKEKVWGGSKLNELYQKEGNGSIGESWEISGIKNSVSVLSNGNLAGKSLNELLTQYKDRLVGKKVYETYGNTFPLLFKLIDAKEDLSVQLHPNDILAKKRHQSFGKNEMWYILETEEDSSLIVGFNSEMNESNYKSHLADNSLSNILNTEKVSQGDCYYIQTGTVHAIGGGIVLAEIQQTSDITYRLYDYNRPGLDGKPRELHTELALEAINFNQRDAKQVYDSKINTPVEICSNPYFITNKLQLIKALKKDMSTIDSFVVYMCIEGNANIQSGSDSIDIKKGETILIPASISEITIQTQSAAFLEVYVP